MKQLLENWKGIEKEEIEIDFPEIRSYTFSPLDKIVFEYDIFSGIETDYVLKNWEVFQGCVFKVPRTRTFVIMTPDGDFMNDAYDTVDLSSTKRLKFLQDQRSAPEGFDQIRADFEILNNFPVKVSETIMYIDKEVHYINYQHKTLPDRVDAGTLQYFKEVAWKNPTFVTFKQNESSANRGPIKGAKTYSLTWPGQRELKSSTNSNGPTTYFEKNTRVKVIRKSIFEIIQRFMK